MLSNAGLLPEHREAVEEAFRTGAISVLVATSTVATGVNLPAQRVIIRDLFVGLPSNFLDATRFRQMCGRAGRAGIDTRGEAVVMLSSKAPAARRTAEELLTAEVCARCVLLLLLCVRRCCAPLFAAVCAPQCASLGLQGMQVRCFCY